MFFGVFSLTPKRILMKNTLTQSLFDRVHTMSPVELTIELQSWTKEEMQAWLIWNNPLYELRYVITLSSEEIKAFMMYQILEVN